MQPFSSITSTINTRYTLYNGTGNWPFSTFPRCSNQQHWPTPKCNHRLPEKDFHRFAHQLSEFLPLYLQIGVNQTLIHRTFKINNTWMGFHTDLQKLSVILRRNLFPENLISRYISKYIQTAVKGGKTQPYSGVEPQETPKSFFKTPYVGHFSVTAQRSIRKRRKLANRLCKP